MRDCAADITTSPAIVDYAARSRLRALYCLRYGLISVKQWPRAEQAPVDPPKEYRAWYDCSRRRNGGLAPEEVRAEMHALGLLIVDNDPYGSSSWRSGGRWPMPARCDEDIVPHFRGAVCYMVTGSFGD